MAPWVNRFIPFLGYHHVLMILLVIAIVLLSILMAGCSNSSTMQNVYLLSLSYVANATSNSPPDPNQLNPGINKTFTNLTSTSNPSLIVRVGYLGICISVIDSQWLCSNSGNVLANSLRVGFKSLNAHKTEDIDPLNLLWIAATFKEKIAFNGLMLTAIPVAFIVFILLSTFPGWHEEENEDGSDIGVKPFPSTAVMRAAITLVVVGSVFSFISSLLQHVGSAAASAMAENLAYGSVKGHVGVAGMVLAWIGTVLYLLVAGGLWMMVDSISALKGLIQYPDSDLDGSVD